MVSMARRLCRCAVSQAPKLCSSVAGASRSTRRSASAAVTKRRRSTTLSGV
jgi:hypothetical protein